MLNIEKLDYECTKKCRYQQHGNQINSALTKRAIDDNKLAAYIVKTCRNFSEIVDKSGRSALHMSCSVDRYTIAEWLINQGSAINCKDYESGSSPLHRAIFYGCIDCAVLLLRYGANCELLDNDTRSPLQECCKMSQTNLKETPTNNDLLVWGTNKNHNIGISSEKTNNLPQFVEFFRKQNVCIVNVSLSTYHSLFLDTLGNLFAVGHGKGGRLGTGSENSLPVPYKVKVPLKDEKICCISCSKNHSLILTNKSSVFACGLNDNQQLGLKTCPDMVTSFKEVTSFKSYGVDDLIRVIATEHHSVAYNKAQIFAWGANFGQFGISSNISHVLLPRLINGPIKSDILFVETNNLGMVCVTSSNQIIVFYNYKVRGIKSPHSQKIKSMSLSGGDSVKLDKGTPSAFKILMLTESNVIFIWYENIQQYLRCSFTHIHLNRIDKIFYKSNQVLILSDSDVYTGKCIQVPVHNHIINDTSTAWHNISQSVNDKCVNQKIRLELNQIPNVDRAVDIFCDDAFSSFAVLQESSQKYYNLPKCLPDGMNLSHCFKELLNGYEEDGMHDIVFHVGNDVFFAHKLIICSRSPGLKSIIEKNSDINVFLNLNGLNAKIFEYILKHIYYNYFVTFEDLNIIEQSVGQANTGELLVGDKSNTIKFLLMYVVNFKLIHLENYLNCLLNELPFEPSNFQFNCLKRTSLSKFYDVIIKCEDDKIIEAHKCVLISRLEYFNLMFAHNWLEKQAVIQLQTVPYDYMLPIVDFLYTFDAEHIRKKNYSQNFLYNLIVFCDQFFASQLQRVCEILILEHLSIRKCGEMLEFACLYNCSTLKLGCLEFIVQNLARVLMAKSLDNCEPEILKYINEFYRNTFKNEFDYRIITPDSEAIEDSVLLSFVDDFEIDLYQKSDSEGLTYKKIKTKENSFKLRTRQYEKDAILSMKELSLNDNKELFKIRKSDIELEAKEISDSIQSEAKTWMKVSVHKKDAKRRPLLPTNNIINEVSKTKTLISNNVDHILPNKIIEPISTNRANLNLSSFTPMKTNKMSQKQRKRLSSESQLKDIAITSPTKPIDIPEKPNAWRVSNVVSPPSESGSKSVEKSILSPSSGSSPKPTSMWKIIAEEKEQREYFNRIRSKSLALTQIEEKAIVELRKFYNVENLDDENITIERYSLPANINFATWQRS